TTPTRYELKFNSKTNNFLKIQFTADNATKDTYVGHIQLEEGNVSSAWDISPEDYKSRFAKNETRITQTEKDITLNASSITQLDTKTTNQYSELKVETDKITSIVSKQDEMDGKIAANTSSIQQLPNQITSQVSAVETRVNDTINDIQVGARNLLENSLSWNKGFEDNSNGNYQYLWRIYIDELLNKVEVGDEISISFDLQMERGDVFRIYDSVVDPGISIGSDTITNVGNKKFRYKYTSKITKTSGTNSRWAIYAYNNNNGDKFSIENIKIEKGNKATDWTPAPEDVNSQIDNIRIGGRNLVLDSKNDKYTNHTLYGKPYNLSLDWIIGETYTVTVKGNPDNEDHYFSAYSDDGYTNLCNLTYDSKKDLWIGTGVAKESSRNLDKLLTIYDMPKDGNYLSSIEWIKLEKGNKATDWSPAPEDIETSISTVSSKIDQKADSIELSVN